MATSTAVNSLLSPGCEPFDIEKVKAQYEKNKKSRMLRELGKWLFSIFTFGIGALILWATTVVVRKGEIGIRRTARGDMVLLPEGRHSNFPWESYPVEPQSLANENIALGPYKIITVRTGHVAKTSNKGKLAILPEGQHIISDPAHTFDGFISTKQETQELDQVIATTKDKVALTLQVEVLYQIENPETAIRQIGDVVNFIKEIAEMAVSSIMSQHTLASFSPKISALQSQDSHGITDVVAEFEKQISAQLQASGIKLINIGIKNWNVSDPTLAHELAQGAVITLKSVAQAEATQRRATAEAAAIRTIGGAVSEVAGSMDTPAKQTLCALQMQCDAARHANNPYLFFGMPAPGQAVVPTQQTPLQLPNVSS